MKNRKQWVGRGIMQDGYYMSVYSHVDPMLNVLGIQHRHDQGFSLWKKTGKNIELVHQCEFERITGIKKHNRCFYDADQLNLFLDSVLISYGIQRKDIVAIWGTNGIATRDDLAPTEMYPEFAEHGIYHLFSAICMDTEKFYNGNILGFSVDGIPDEHEDLYCYCTGYSSNGKLELLPAYSPGLLWGYLTLHYRLQEGTLMALASASTSAFIDPPQNIFLYNRTERIDEIYQELCEFTKSLEQRADGFTQADVGRLFTGYDPRFSIEENKISMVMKVFQSMSIRIMEQNIDHAINRYQINTAETYLAMAGGFALNCPTNSYLMQKYQFKGFIAPPSVSDTGISMGMGLFGFYKAMKDFNFQLEHPYYGNHYDLDEFLSIETNKPYIKHVSDFDIDQVLDDIEQNVIVWFNNQSEIGPRALGNRSLLGDPRTMTTKDMLNECKQRQWWRPVAPMVLEENLTEWFEGSLSSPFMLMNFDVCKEKRNTVPAIVHCDGSARVQTVSKQDNASIYRILKAFQKRTGVPILCNTSLNDRGEPIIERIEEAVNFALRKGLTIIYVNEKRIELSNHCDFQETQPASRKKDATAVEKRIEWLTKKMYNPHGATADALVLYRLCNLGDKFDLRSQKDTAEMNEYLKERLEQLGIEKLV